MKTTERPTQQNYLATAIKIAAEAHEAQVDRGGNAYVLHPLRLMLRLRTDDAELMQIAVLHDVIEDAEYASIDWLRHLGFSERVLDALSFLAHDKGVPYRIYIANIAKNADATRVKIEDLRDNSDITRLKGVRPKDLERLEKYHHAYIYLTTNGATS